MARLEFPDSPGLNSVYVGDNGVTYTWNGTYWSANDGAALDARYVQVAGDTMTGNLTVPSMNTGALAGLRNQLINGNALIFQRGLSITTVGYGPDHWDMSSGLTRIFQKSNGSGFIPNAPSPYLFGWEASTGSTMTQPIELDRTGEMSPFLPGTTWTFSFYWTGTTVPGVAFSFNDGTGDFNAGDVIVADAVPSYLGGERYYYTFTIPSNQTIASTRTNFGARFITKSNSDDYITCIQFEPGPVATPFEQRPIQTEIDLCRRYFQVIDYYSSNGGIFSIDASWYIYSVVFNPPMRVTPTLAYSAEFGSNSGQFKTLDYTGAEHLGAVIEGRSSPQGVSFRGYSGSTTVLVDGRLAFDAEL